jgi:hypothetical protein
MIRMFRQLVSPEVLWERWNRPYLSMVRTLSFLFCVDLYELSSSQRSDLGRFYATFPETAAFIVLRAKHEAECCIGKGAPAESLAHRVLRRIFGAIGTSVLEEVTWMFEKAKEEEFRQISRDASLLAQASVRDLKHATGIANASAALARGRQFAEANGMADISENEKMLIGEHWLKCGDVITKHFELWVQADRAAHAMNRVLRKLNGP